MDWVFSRQPSILEARLNTRGAAASCLVDVPKENFALRPAMILDPIDRLAYQALVGRASVKLIGDLDPNVFGWRLPAVNPRSGRRSVNPRPRRSTVILRPGKYARNDHEWNSYRKHISELASRYDAALKTDVVSFFAGIPVDRLCAQVEAILTSVGMAHDADRLTSFLQAWDKVPGRSGVPQRCQASSVLANMYLSRVDSVLADVSKKFTSIGKSRGTRSFARWMDDIWLFGDDAGELRQAQVEIQRALASLGLHINVAKTKLLEGKAVVEQVRKVEHSAIDEGLKATPMDIGPLNTLIGKIVEEKETANRTSVRFVAERMRAHRNFRRINRIRDVAARMPHAADHLGRLFRDARRAVKLQEWFLDYRDSSWGVMEWPAAQFATMFPSARRSISMDLVRNLSDALSGSAESLPLLAVTAQRLAVWNPPLARQSIEDAVERVSGPLERRVLALAGLNAGIPVPTVQRWLRDFPENAVTVNMLTDMSFTPLQYELDFAGD